MGFATLQTAQQKSDFLKKHDAYVFDCDGVIWQGTSLLPGAREFLKHLHDKGKKLIFVTNNSSKSRKQYHKKFCDLGLEFIEISSINGTANATAEYLSSQDHPIKKIFVIGLSGFTHELEEFGFETVPLPKESTDLEELADMELDPDVNAVVVGFDNAFNYTKLATACLFIRYNPGCKFIATNLDAGSMQGKKHSRLIAGTGCLVRSVEVGCGRVPDLVIGKPSEWWINHIIDHHGLDRKRTVMFGDRLDTDMVFARQGGIESVLVMTGVTHSTEGIPQEMMPDFVVGGLGDFVEVLKDVE